MRILLFGADGQVGWELQRALSPLGTLTALDRRQADLEGPVAPLILQHRPDVVVNAAAYTAVDRAENEPELAQRLNAGAVAEMAQAAATIGAQFVHYSTDYVFDGRKDGPYAEDDPTAPLNAYGRSKRDGEIAVIEAGGRHLIFRTSWVYAARGKNFARTILERARDREQLRVVADTRGVPTSAELVADVTALAIYRTRRAARPEAAAADERRQGIFHLVPSGATTWHGYACHLVERALAAGLALRTTPDRIEAVGSSAFPAAALRPRNSLLDHGRLCSAFHLQLPDWRHHVDRFVATLAREVHGT